MMTEMVHLRGRTVLERTQKNPAFSLLTSANLSVNFVPLLNNVVVALKLLRHQQP